MLPYSNRPSAEAIIQSVPGLASYGRPAVVLHPTPGAPGPHDSSVAGPMLWPGDEPWPHCSVPDERASSGLPPVAMLPVVQVLRRDAPGEWWPEGADVFQLLWCPNTHWDPPTPQADGSPVVEIRWRQAATLPPAPLQPPAPVRQEDDDYGFTPRPCLLTPIALTDFPYPQELPPSLQDEVYRLVEETGRDDDGGDIITRVAGSKFGGWPTWHLTEPRTMLCRQCGAAMTLLFTVASDATTGITVGRWGDLRVFSCSADSRHGYEFDVH